MPLIINSSGIVFEVSDNKILESALLRGCRLVNEDKTNNFNKAIQILLRVKQPIEVDESKLQKGKII